jgi:YHYH protein
MKFRMSRHYGHSPRHPPPPLCGDEDWRMHSQQHLGGSQVKNFTQDRYRYIVGNGLPNHAIDLLLNPNGSNLVRPQQYFFRVPIDPRLAEQITEIHRQPFGVAINGVPFDPESAEFWNGDRHSGWQYEAMSVPGLDRNNGHTRSNGAYHYHGLPVGLMIRLLGSSQVLLIGYAADGFPIYGQHDACSPGSIENLFRKVHPSYRLKKGQRLSGPRGEYDGTFVQDYEYVEAAGDLDRCNGHFGVTPEYPDGIYHYHITEEFPFISRYFRGIPDASFRRQQSHPRS